MFCKIVRGEIPSQKVSDTVNVLAFYDIDPGADTHIVVIPKKHINAFLDLKREHYEILTQLLRVTQQIIIDKKIDSKYKIVINGGENQFVPHLHWHILGGNLKKRL